MLRVRGTLALRSYMHSMRLSKYLLRYTKNTIHIFLFLIRMAFIHNLDTKKIQKRTHHYISVIFYIFLCLKIIMIVDIIIYNLLHSYKH